MFDFDSIPTAEQIGVGFSATAYRTGDIVLLCVDKTDDTREVLTQLKGKHFPKIKKIHEEENYRWYKMPYYEDFNETIPQFCKKINQIFYANFDCSSRRKSYQNMIISIQKEKTLSLSLRRSMIKLLTKILEMPQLPFFDVNEDNVSLYNGNIILRDLFCP
jgi:hypothetical protein